MGVADLLTSPGLWGSLAQVGQSLAGRDSSSFGYTMGGYAKNLAQAEAYRKELEKIKKAEEEKQKGGTFGKIGSVIGSTAGFLLGGGPAGAAAGAALGNYAGERLGGMDPNEAPIAPALVNAGVGYGVGKATDYLGGKLQDLNASPQVKATPSPEQSGVASAASTTPSGGDVPLEAPMQNTSSAAASKESLDPTRLTRQDWMKLAQHPDYHTRLAAALMYSLNTPNPGPVAGAGSSLGGGSTSMPPLSSGSFGMSPELVSQINDTILNRWKAKTQADTAQQELGLKNRQVSTEESRVQNEQIRAMAELYRATKEKGFNYSKSIETVDDNGDPVTLIMDPAHPEATPLKFPGQVKVQSGDILDSTVPDEVMGANSGTGYWKVRHNVRTGEQTAVPTVPPAYTFRNPPAVPAPDITEEVKDGKKYRVARDKQSGQELWRQEQGTTDKIPKARRESDGSTSTFDPATNKWRNDGQPEEKYVRREFLRGLTQKDGSPIPLDLDTAKSLIDSLAPGWSAESKAKFADSVSKYINVPPITEPGKIFGNLSPNKVRDQKPSEVMKFEEPTKSADNSVGPYGAEFTDPKYGKLIWDQNAKDPKTGKLGAYVGASK